MSLVVLQFFHQADLCFLFNRFVCRSVFTYAEGVVRPDELNRLFHQGSHANCGFHVVREYEERTASYDYTSVERHTDTQTGHRQFGYAGLKECTAEITFHECMCFFQEAVGLVRVGKVGG